MSDRAIFFVDPGGSSGVAWGVFNDRADTVANAMLSRDMSGSATIHQGRIEGANPVEFQRIIRDQVAEIIELWRAFYDETFAHCDFAEFGIEHFVLTGGVQHRPGVEGIFPAFMVGALIMEVCEEIFLQTAGKGMKWHTRKFHDSYQTWVVGKEHEREAWAHVAARLHDVLR